MGASLGGRPIATIDVGTNTTLLLVAQRRAPDRAGGDPGQPEVLEDVAQITRLGRGIGSDGLLGREGIDRTLAALSDCARLARRHDAEIVAVGTEALRRAANAREFLQPAERILGVPVEVISGDREATLTFRATVESFPGEMTRGRVAVVDLGGGSTEIIVSDQGLMKFRCSVPLGSVRLHERHIHGDPPSTDETAAIENEVAATLEAAAPDFMPGTVTTLVGVAGTVTSLAAMVLALPTYDSSRVHGFSLSRFDLDAQIARLQTSVQADRVNMVGLDPKRADVIFAGALLLREIARRAGIDTVLVSDRGIRWGLYYERAAPTRP